MNSQRSTPLSPITRVPGVGREPITDGIGKLPFWERCRSVASGFIICHAGCEDIEERFRISGRESHTLPRTDLEQCSCIAELSDKRQLPSANIITNFSYDTLSYTDAAQDNTADDVVDIDTVHMGAALDLGSIHSQGLRVANDADHDWQFAILAEILG